MKESNDRVIEKLELFRTVDGKCSIIEIECICAVYMYCTIEYYFNCSIYSF